MEWKTVKSTIIRRVGYCRVQQLMVIEFTYNDETDHYYVPEDIFTGFVSARSVGQYFQKHLANL